MTFYIENNQLVSEEKWNREIDSLNTPYSNTTKNQEESVKKLAETIESSFRGATENEEHIGILFSGGVDSTLLAFLAKKHKIPFTCYTIGLKDSTDLEQAKKVASHYNFNHTYQELSLEQFESTLKEAIKILQSIDIIWVSVGSVTLASSKLAKKNGEKIIFTGLGTEELFAGYNRHENANPGKELHQECINGLKSMYQRDILRDIKLAQDQRLKFKTPYLSKKMISVGMSIHPELKLSDSEDKLVLRKAAISLGLEEQFANTPKKAAQYGSRVVKGLDKLAKKRNFKTKKEYLESIFKEIKE